VKWFNCFINDIHQNLGWSILTWTGLYYICDLKMPDLLLSRVCLPTLNKGFEVLSDLFWIPTDDVVS